MKKLNQEIHHLPRPDQPHKDWESVPTQPLCVGAKVVLEKNLWFEGRLLNGSIGEVLEIKYVNDSPAPGELPEYVLVKFDNFMGLELYPSGTLAGVPIVPILGEKKGEKSKKPKMVRYIPLRGAYGITVHKTQSLTLPKAAIFLDDREIFSGMDFVSFSRVKRLEDIAILDSNICTSRLVYDNDYVNGFFQIQLAEQERLEALAAL